VQAATWGRNVERVRSRFRLTFVAALVLLMGCSEADLNSARDAVANDSDAQESSAPTAEPTAVTDASTLDEPADEASDTTEAPVTDGRDESCIVSVVAGDSLGQIAGRIDGVGLSEIESENGISGETVIHPGDELDVCIGNDVDDVTGSSRLAPPADVVQKQQSRLNQLFAPYRLIPLGLDGDSGPLTRQMLCTARMGLGLPVSGGHMTAGSDEEQLLMTADGFGVPEGAATWANKWILIDKTCQVMFIGEGDKLVNIYPTSTGEPGFETRNGQSFSAFRYDPALDTDGWHDSTNFPVAVDDPLNGNMYKPIYFNSGQAIHGANYVPADPQSKGCARTFPLHQEELIAWLGIDDIKQPTWRESDIGVTVTVQGAFRSID